MYWLKIGNLMVNLAQVTDVELNVRAGATTELMVTINFASLALVDGELEGRAIHFSGEDAKAIRGYFRSLSGKQMTTLMEYEASTPPEVTAAPADAYCPGCDVLTELCQCQTQCSPCPPSEAVSSNKKLQQVFVALNVNDLRAALADPDGTLKTALESLKGKRVE